MIIITFRKIVSRKLDKKSEHTIAVPYNLRREFFVRKITKAKKN